MKLFAKTALLGCEWVSQVRIEIQNGHIARIIHDSTPETGDIRIDTVLPALSNLHSHSFQRAMAGMTEYRNGGKDSFWTWRELMYRFVATLEPDDVAAIAAMVFMEMQEAGFAAVGEFHYLHHQRNGLPFNDLSEMSESVFSAANLTGIGLTHLPVLYTYGGVQQKPIAESQYRFYNSLDNYLELLATCRQSVAANLPEDSVVGVAPHSLRAVSAGELKELLVMEPQCPVHIHIAEQLKEVEEIEMALGLPPVKWLLNNATVDERWCLVHATLMTGEETQALARSNAVAGLCPITEANLGDGPFNGPDYVMNSGRFGLGSDSNVRISLTEELRTLEYSQRLRDRARNLWINKDGSVGQFIYTGAALGGAQALARKAGVIREGSLADLVAINRKHPTLCALDNEQLLDGLSFVATDNVVTDVWSAGRHQVRNGRHIAHDAIVAAFRSTVKSLIAKL